MRPLIKVIVVVSFLLVTVNCLLLTAEGAVPHLINYQAKLTDNDGNPLNGAYDITFRIYDAAAAGNLLWEESHQGAVIQKGIFNILLGSVNDFNLAFDKPYWLAIKVGTDAEMSPRQIITASGYAIRAGTSERLETDHIIDAKGGLIIENRTSDPSNPVTGQIWLRTDIE